MDVLAEELTTVKHDDSNVLVITGKKRKRSSTESSDAEDPDVAKPHKRKKVNKRKLKEEKEEKRRLAALEAKMQKLRERKVLFEQLAKTQVTPEQAKFLLSSSKVGRGKTVSKKEKVKRAVLEEKYGLPRSDPSVMLVKEKEVNIDTSQRPQDTSHITEQFVQANAELLKCKKKKEEPKKKVKVRKDMAPVRTLFAYIESDSDDDRDVARSDDEDDSSEEEEVITLGTTNNNNTTAKPKEKSDTEEDKATPAEHADNAQKDETQTNESKNQEEKDKETQTSDAPAATSTAPRTGWVIPDFGAKPLEERKKRKLTWAPGEIPTKPTAKTSVPETKTDSPPKESEEARGTYQPPEQTAMEKLLSSTEDTTTEQKTDQVLRKRNPAYYVLVDRTKDVELVRSELPIIMEEQQIVEKILKHDVVIICGETGSGKTTQVPQFLYEAGYGDPNSKTPGMIGVTEPRRVAAVSTAQRVAYELNQAPPSLDDRNSTPAAERKTAHVAYQVRYDGTVSKETRIKFMTDGILLREIQSDFLLKKYSAILIDEAHERTMNTDILLGLLCRIVPLRRELYEEQKRQTEGDTMECERKDLDIPTGSTKVVSPLKLIIMSATLRVADFTENRRMFPKEIPPVINIASRQYPVTIHFNKRTSVDYVNDAYKKVIKIHLNLPPGGILVFLTGQQEVEQLCDMLRAYFEKHRRKVLQAKKAAEAAAQAAQAGEEDDNSEESDEEEMINPEDLKLKPKLPSEEVKRRKEEEAKRKQDYAQEIAELDALVLPLYSMLPPAEQMKVFGDVPPKTRLIVVATNVAETSLTIPGISYVVDSGRVKQKVYDKRTGMSSYVVRWTSKASANQRAGRAGRTGPGHCYRLYSSAMYQELQDHTTPDILTIPIEGVVLQMKHMGISKIQSFPFPTPPDVDSVSVAHETLYNIGALEKGTGADEYTITAMGKALVNFPVHPRFAKMLVLAQQGDCLDYIIAIVAVLAVGDPFLHEINPAQTQQNKRTIWSAWVNETSDLLVWLAAVGAYEYATNPEEFCSRHRLHPKLMKEIHLLRIQLTNIISGSTGNKLPQLKPPTRQQKVLLRQIIASGLIDHVARRVPEVNEQGEPISGKWKYNTAIGLQECRIHPASFLYGVSPEYVVYNELIETSDGKVYMKGVTAVSISWMPSLGSWLCKNMDRPLESPPPRYDPKKDRIRVAVEPCFVHSDWKLPIMMVEMKGIEVYKFFAQFFLEGLICPEMKRFQQYINSKPSLITTTWAQHKIAAIVQPLLDHKIDTKQKLFKQWERDPKFWLSAVAMWIDPSQHEELKRIWPPIPTEKKQNK